MQTRILKNKDTYAVMSYHDKLCMMRLARIVKASNFSITWNQKLPTKLYLCYFSKIQALNKRVNRNLLYVEIKFSTNAARSEKLVKLTEIWLNKMGYGDMPYLIFRLKVGYSDIVHILSCRINKNGKKQSRDFEGEKSSRIDQKIENKLHRKRLNKKIKELQKCQYFKSVDIASYAKVLGFSTDQMFQSETEDTLQLKKENFHFLLPTNNLLKKEEETGYYERKQNKIRQYIKSFWHGTMKETATFLNRQSPYLMYYRIDKEGAMSYVVKDRENAEIYNGNDLFPNNQLFKLREKKANAQEQIINTYLKEGKSPEQLIRRFKEFGYFKRGNRISHKQDAMSRQFPYLSRQISILWSREQPSSLT